MMCWLRPMGLKFWGRLQKRFKPLFECRIREVRYGERNAWEFGVRGGDADDAHAGGEGGGDSGV